MDLSSRLNEYLASLFKTAQNAVRICFTTGLKRAEIGLTEGERKCILHNQKQSIRRSDTR